MSDKISNCVQPRTQSKTPCEVHIVDISRLNPGISALQCKVAFTALTRHNIAHFVGNQQRASLVHGYSHG
jgi:hypothetical protein